MTDYAYDANEHTLVTSWSTGAGLRSKILARLPAVASTEDALLVASSLTALSANLWRCYTHPASASSSLKPNSEGWRRQGERDAFTSVSDAVRNPNLPQDGFLLSSYISVEEAAHGVGRALHSISSADLTSQIVRDIDQEIEAVERAERGDLTGRAKQAVTLAHSDVSPLQVVAANAIFQEEPLGSSRFFDEVDPTAAAVAAAHWLQAAANVASLQAGCAPTEVVIEADNIEAVAVGTPTDVLNMLETGATPRPVIISMVNDAMTVAEGKIPDPDRLFDEIAQARTKAEKYGPGDQELSDALMPRLTPLDPMRPTHDLLEDLLSGIRACYLLYREYADYPDYEFEDDIEESGDEFARQIEEREESIAAEFISALREEAESKHSRIL